ncbi:hypothetical protein APTSU1_000459400 [Apodemus speciosus]|uniref:Uncharacterized protein n=1 Tax=Apodemus speciosus TaxID=105296 RepID=A0ABQ0EQN0_APOSI
MDCQGGGRFYKIRQDGGSVCYLVHGAWICEDPAWPKVLLSLQHCC